MNVKLWTLNFLKDLNFWRQQAWQTQLKTKATVVYHIFKLTAREKVHQQFSLFLKKTFTVVNSGILTFSFRTSYRCFILNLGQQVSNVSQFRSFNSKAIYEVRIAPFEVQQAKTITFPFGETFSRWKNIQTSNIPALQNEIINFFWIYYKNKGAWKGQQLWELCVPTKTEEQRICHLCNQYRGAWGACQDRGFGREHIPHTSLW